jgi:tetratricopeptide (TPR) repeat protein
VLRYPQAARAIEIFKRDGTGLNAIALRLPPDDLETRRRINETSIAALTEHLEAAPDDAGAWMSLAHELVVAGRKPQAIDAAAKALQHDYGRAEWRLYRAHLLSDLDRLPEAVDEVQIVLRGDPHSNEAKALLDQLQDPKRRRKSP